MDGWVRWLTTPNSFAVTRVAFGLNISFEPCTTASVLGLHVATHVTKDVGTCRIPAISATLTVSVAVGPPKSLSSDVLPRMDIFMTNAEQSKRSHPPRQAQIPPAKQSPLPLQSFGHAVFVTSALVGVCVTWSVGAVVGANVVGALLGSVAGKAMLKPELKSFKLLISSIDNGSNVGVSVRV